MKDLPSSAQSAIEYGVVALLIVIIIAGSYKLYKNWTAPEPVKTQSRLICLRAKSFLKSHLKNYAPMSQNSVPDIINSRSTIFSDNR